MTVTEAPMISKNLLQKSILQDSFFEFMQYHWDTVVPEEPVWNWHIEYICDEMQKVAERVFNNEKKKYDLVINVPPGSTKSTICSIMFPPWTWINMPSARSICSSYSNPLSLQLSRKSRDVVNSDKYQNLFDVRLRQDQQTKSNFENIQGGYRYATSVGGTAMGFHAHFLIADDLLNPLEAASEVGLKNANSHLRDTLSTRKVDKDVTVTVLIMQRLHEDDPTAMTLNQKKAKVRHINLPAEITLGKKMTVRPRSLKRKYKKDPDKKGTQLLDPIRLNRSVLDEALDKLLEYSYAGQFLQSPVPLEGGMFKTARIHADIPPVSRNDWIQKVRFWDKAGTEGGGAFTVGLLMGEDKQNRFWILDVIRVQLDTWEREKLVKQTAKIDISNEPRTKIGIEQEPGSGGKESALGTIKNLAGFNIEAVNPTGDKVQRAVSFSKQVNGENVYMAPGEWNQTYINELTLFPNSKYKDQVDASSGAFTLMTFSEQVEVGAYLR
ncbi:MAG: phage terminase large subunit [Candidatus Heimdallarchaeaceae archaeon]